MSARSWIFSLLFPVLSIIIITVIVIVLAIGSDGNMTAEDLFAFMFMLLFGSVVSGIAPIIIIAETKTDTSDYAGGKIILFIALAVIFVVLWAFDLYSAMIFIMPVLILTAEAVFAAVQKTDLKTKLCMFLSSPSFIYVGFMIDMIRLLTDPN